MKEQDAKLFLKIKSIIQNYKKLKDDDRQELSIGHDIDSLSINERKNIIYLLKSIGLSESFSAEDFKKVSKDFRISFHSDKIESFSTKFGNDCFDRDDLEGARNLFNILQPAIKFIDGWFKENTGAFNLSNDFPKSPSEVNHNYYQDFSDDIRPDSFQNFHQPSPSLNFTILARDFLDSLSTKLADNLSKPKPTFFLFSLFQRCINDRSLDNSDYSKENIKKNIFKILTDYRREQFREGFQENQLIVNATDLENGRLAKDQVHDILKIITSKVTLNDNLNHCFIKSFHEAGALNQDKLKFFVNDLMVSSRSSKPLDQRFCRASRYPV